MDTCGSTHANRGAAAASILTGAATPSRRRRHGQGVATGAMLVPRRVLPGGDAPLVRGCRSALGLSPFWVAVAQNVDDDLTWTCPTNPAPEGFMERFREVAERG